MTRHFGAASQVRVKKGSCHDPFPSSREAPQVGATIEHMSELQAKHSDHLIQLQINQSANSQAWMKFLVGVQGELGVGYFLLVRSSGSSKAMTIFMVVILTMFDGATADSGGAVSGGCCESPPGESPPSEVRIKRGTI